MAVVLNGTEQQWLVTASTDTLGAIGIFDKMTGGDMDAKVTLHRPGGMGALQSFLALPEPTAVTISRVYVEDRDHALIGQLRTLVGSDYLTISAQPLDQNAAPFGTPTIYRGRLTNVKAGNADSTSSTPRMFDLDIIPENVVN